LALSKKDYKRLREAREAIVKLYAAMTARNPASRRVARAAIARWERVIARIQARDR
jgi:hypothetical protein